MTKRIKEVVIICFIFALCVCNLSFKAITSEAAGKKVTARWQK